MPENSIFNESSAWRERDAVCQKRDIGDRYTRTAIALHWLIAMLIIFNLAIGFIMEDFPTPVRKPLVAAHISAGITALILTAARVVWRLTHQPPAHLNLRGWEIRLSKWVHGLLYVCMIVVPLSGWILISANPPMGSAGAALLEERAAALVLQGQIPPPVRVTGKQRFWWIAPLPVILPINKLGASAEGVDRQRELHDKAVEVHSYLACAMIALLALHIAGALKHQLWDRQQQFARMGLGWLYRRSRRL